MKKIKIVKDGKRYFILRKKLFGFTRWFKWNKVRYTVDFSSYEDAYSFALRTYDNVKIVS